MIMKNDYSKRSMPLNWGVSIYWTMSKYRYCCKAVGYKFAITI